MNGDGDNSQDLGELQTRLSNLSEAALRISGSLDLDSVLREVVDSARSLTDARYAVLTTLDDSAGAHDFLTSGITPEESTQLHEMSGGPAFCEYLSNIPEPLRLRDIASYIKTLGFPDLDLPMAVSGFLAAPIRGHGRGVGNIYLGRSDGDEEFTHHDEKMLEMFASHAALVISNARAYRKEHRARTALETLVSTSPVGVVEFDASTQNVVTVNQEARRILGDRFMPGISLKDFLDGLTLQLSDGREIALNEYPLVEALCAGKTVRAEEIVIELPDSRKITTLVNASPIYSEAGEVTSAIVTLQDMTPLIDMERLRLDFLGMVSHELRTPLTAIKGSAATALESSSPMDPAETLQIFRIVSEQSDRMRDLLNNLLDVTRIETGTLSVSPRPAAVADIVDQARTSFLSTRADNVVDVDIPSGLPQVLADTRRIVQVLSNLLFNASKYSPKSSTISVSARQEDLLVVISVSDEGIGIPDDRLPLLFRKFSRLGDSYGKSSSEGTGLGLAVSKGIVEAHGGRIWAESDGTELGARFNFTVPVAEYIAEDTAQQSARTLLENEQRPCILIVDDDPQILRSVRETLSEAGYDTTVTGDPDAVEDLVRTAEPNLVLLDLMLPGADGIDLMPRIVRIADVPIIFLSAYGRDQYIARAFEMGATDYVVKPFSPTELVARISSALRRQARTDQTASPQPYTLGDLRIDYGYHQVTLAGEPVRLTATEYALLFELSVNSGRALTHDQLLMRVWDSRSFGDPRVVRSIIKKLRQKLGDDARNPTYIFTEPGVGYRMAKPLAELGS